MIRIVIIEEHKPDIKSLKSLLHTQKDFEIVGTGKDGYDALILVEKEKPDIALLNTFSPMQDWGAAIYLIKSKSSKTSVIVLSATHEEESILKVICSGVSGFLSTNTSPELFIAGIRTVYNGGSLISAELFAKAYTRFRDTHAKRPKLNDPENHRQAEKRPLPDNLTRIELRVIIYIGRGFSNREIADIFNLKEGTIRNHITSILQKTGFRNRTQVAIYAFNIGLMDANSR
ncbi:MAG: response regulator transcription factor [Spirochaetaceae bacterium]|jgi:DNA-binding NarL/FixJ family response regulator|nr:response regulator transcription factor [Spirochaetaceae bacterium]